MTSFKSMIKEVQIMNRQVKDNSDVIDNNPILYGMRLITGAVDNHMQHTLSGESLQDWDKLKKLLGFQ